MAQIFDERFEGGHASLDETPRLLLVWRSLRRNRWPADGGIRRVARLPRLAGVFEAHLQHLAILRLEDHLDAEHRIAERAARPAAHPPPDPAATVHPARQPVSGIQNQDPEDKNLETGDHGKRCPMLTRPFTRGSAMARQLQDGFRAGDR